MDTKGHSEEQFQKTPEPGSASGRLKVLLSSYGCQPGEGSEAGMGFSWAYELAKAGASVWVLTIPNGRDAIEEFLREHPDLALNFTYISHPPLGEALRNLTRGGHSWNHLLGYLQWQDRAFEIARVLHKEVNFDVVHHVSLTSLHIGSRLWRLKRPFIFGPVGGAQTAPSGFTKYLKGKLLFERARSIVAKYLYPYLLNARSTVRGADLVLVTNRETQAAVQRLGARKVQLMTDIGISDDRIAPETSVRRSSRDPLRILWIARLEPRKALLLALETVAQVQCNVAWRLTVIGYGPQEGLVEDWLRELSLSDRVEWLGRVPYREVQKVYDTTDVLLFTSLRDTTGIQLIEAMGRGVPIITLDHQGASFIVPDSAGIKVPVTTPQETRALLARAIEELAGDRDRLQKMGEAAIQVAKLNTYQRKAKDALALYHEIIESSTICNF